MAPYVQLSKTRGEWEYWQCLVCKLLPIKHAMMKQKIDILLLKVSSDLVKTSVGWGKRGQIINEKNRMSHDEAAMRISLPFSLSKLILFNSAEIFLLPSLNGQADEDGSGRS